MKEIRHAYESQVGSIAIARNAVADFARDCGFCANEIADIRLAAGEACVNAVQHAHTPLGRFIVSCSYDEDILSVRVADLGGQHAIRDKAGPQIWPSKTGDALGLMLIRALMDESELEIRHDTGSTMTMRKLRSLHAGASGLGEA